ncbi:MAG: tetratricopeptide repeat protein [Deltaproteobacteria bacterium]|nr:tetratricopeptide repeat protein [Deltaproteobacteria bacterium]
MKHLWIKCLLCACLSFFCISFLRTGMGHSQEKGDKFSIPPLKQGVTSPKRGGVQVVPVKPGDEIPDWVARWELARVLSYVKQYDESISEYEKVLRKKPDLTEAKLEMARVLFWKGDQKRALQVLEAVPPQAIEGDTQVLMADLFVAQKEYQKAEPLYREYLAHHPQDQAVRLKLAEMLSWEKKYEASLSEYRKILEVSPHDIQVRRRYAFVLIWAGKPEQAASELKKTLD